MINKTNWIKIIRYTGDAALFLSIISGVIAVITDILILYLITTISSITAIMLMIDLVLEDRMEEK